MTALLIAPPLAPFTSKHNGFSALVVVAAHTAVFMTTALFVFVRGRSGYYIVMPETNRSSDRGDDGDDGDDGDCDGGDETLHTKDDARSPFGTLGRVVWCALCTPRVSPTHDGLTFLELAIKDCGEAKVEAAKDFFRTFQFACIMPFFWMLYDQQGSVWILQAERMDLGNFLEPENMGLFNTLLVLIFLPIFEKFLYPILESRGLQVTALRRICSGMFLASVAFLMSAWVEHAIVEAGEGQISVWYQLPQYAVLSVAEIGVSTTGLEFFYAEAPPQFKTATAALFLLTTAVGDLMGGILYTFAGLIGETDEDILVVCAVLMLIASIFFVREARRYTYRGSDEDITSKSSGGGDDVEMSETIILMSRGGGSSGSGSGTGSGSGSGSGSVESKDKGYDLTRL